MSNVILILGDTGTGKTTACRNLNPAETFFIRGVSKPLPFKGWKSKYVEKKNLLTTDNHKIIMNYIEAVSARRPEIKTIIIDDSQYIMANEFMRRATETGYTKFTEIGRNFWRLVTACNNIESDINIVFLHHSDNKETSSVMKTVGKILDSQMTIQGLFTVVLYSLLLDGKYVFLTNNDGYHLAKSPFEMFDEPFIVNDLAIVINKVNEYYSGDIETINTNEEQTNEV